MSAWDTLAEKIDHCEALRPYIVEKYGSEEDQQTIADAWNKALSEMLVAAKAWVDESKPAPTSPQ